MTKQISTKTNKVIGSSTFRRLWLFGWLAVGALLLYFAMPGDAPTMERSAGGESSPRVQTAAHRAVELPTKPIEEIQVGERVMGHNPDPTDAQRNIPDPDPANWRKIQLRMSKESGKSLDITLLRPTTWIEGIGAAIHRTIHLDMKEMDAVGPAEVLSIAACPPIKDGPGQVVTGTFSHEPEDNLVNVWIEGLDAPIGCTNNHRFWSETRQDFIEADDLQAGEQLRTRAPGFVHVESITHRPPIQRVYNLEVHGEHVYEVTQRGILVHNSYTLISVGGNSAHITMSGKVAQIEIGYIQKASPAFSRAIRQHLRNSGATRAVINTGPVQNMDEAIRLGLKAQQNGKYLGGTVRLVSPPGAKYPIFEIILDLVK